MINKKYAHDKYYEYYSPLILDKFKLFTLSYQS